MEFVHLQQWLYTYHTQNKHDDCGLVYSMNVAYLHKNAFLISISAPFFSLFLAICVRFIARYGGSLSALLSSRHDIGPNPAEIIFSAIEPKELIRFGWNIAQIPGCVFGAARSHIPLIHSTPHKQTYASCRAHFAFSHACASSFFFFFLFPFRIVVACASSCMPSSSSSSSSSLRRSTIRMRNFEFIPRSHKFLFNHIAHIFEILKAFS